MHRTRLLLILGFALSVTAPAAASGSAGLVGSCNYYDARSAEMNCSPDGYLVHFGANYCRRFDSAWNQFSSDGQAALGKIKICLQKKLENAAGLTCDNVLQVAAESHVPCYVENHFCQMSAWDKWVLAQVVGPALVDPVLRSAIGKIEQECLRERF